MKERERKKEIRFRLNEYVDKYGSCSHLFSFFWNGILRREKKGDMQHGKKWKANCVSA